MEEQIEETKKWEGKAKAEVKGPHSRQIWALLCDFCAIHKWLPHVDTCYPVDGGSADGEPGLIRYCASTQPTTAPPSSDHDEAAVVKWVKERLIAIDPMEKRLSYEIVENNAGFGSYVATLKVIDGGDEEEEEGCAIEWSYVAEPVVGWTPQDLLSFVDLTVHAMARRMEEALLQPCNN